MESENLALRQLTMDDFETVYTWSQNDLFCLSNEWELNRKREEMYDWWKSVVHHPPKSFIRLGIDFQEKLIGYADLSSITDYSAELGIAIGETELWGRSLGYRAAKQMIIYGMQELGLKVVYAEIHETNSRSRRMLQRLGFKQTSIKGSELYLGEMNRLIQYKIDVIPE